MTISCVPGRVGVFRAGAGLDDSTALVDGTLNVTIDELECTTHGDSVRNFIPNLPEATLDLTFRWDETDPVQATILANTLPVGTFLVEFLLEDAAGKTKFTATAFPTSYGPGSPLDDTATLDVSLRLSDLATATI